MIGTVRPTKTPMLRVQRILTRRTLPSVSVGKMSFSILKSRCLRATRDAIDVPIVAPFGLRLVGRNGQPSGCASYIVASSSGMLSLLHATVGFRGRWREKCIHSGSSRWQRSGRAASAFGRKAHGRFPPYPCRGNFIRSSGSACITDRRSSREDWGKGRQSAETRC